MACWEWWHLSISQVRRRRRFLIRAQPIISGLPTIVANAAVGNMISRTSTNLEHICELNASACSIELNGLTLYFKYFCFHKNKIPWQNNVSIWVWWLFRGKEEAVVSRKLSYSSWVLSLNGFVKNYIEFTDRMKVMGHMANKQRIDNILWIYALSR